MASLITSALSGTASAAHSAFATLAATSPLAVGSTLPDIECKVNKPDEKINLSKVGGKIVVVTLPAAFSPSCSEVQVPGFISKYDEFKSKGVQGIYVVSVNDAFVMKAWKKSFEKDFGESEVHFVGDDTGAWSGATGLIFDAQPFLGGPRAKRSAMIVENGKVLHIGVEANPPEVTVSSAESILAKL